MKTLQNVMEYAINNDCENIPKKMNPLPGVMSWPDICGEPPTDTTPADYPDTFKIHLTEPAGSVLKAVVEALADAGLRTLWIRIADIYVSSCLFAVRKGERSLESDQPYYALEVRPDRVFPRHSTPQEEPHILPNAVKPVTNFDRIVQGGPEAMLAYRHTPHGEVCGRGDKACIDSDCKATQLAWLNSPAKPKLTDEERALFRAAIQDYGFVYAARDKNGTVWFYHKKPFKHAEDGVSVGSGVKYHGPLPLSWISWSDTEPVDLAKVLEVAG